MIYDFILFGLTSGGSKALYSIIDKFDSSFEIPIIIIQNLPPGFDKIFSQVFQEKAKIPLEIVDNEIQMQNKIYFAKSGNNLDINKEKYIKAINSNFTGRCISDFIKKSLNENFKPIIVCLAGALVKDEPIEALKIAKENNIPIIVQKIDDDPNIELKYEIALPEKIIKENLFTISAKINEIPEVIKNLLK